MSCTIGNGQAAELNTNSNSGIANYASTTDMVTRQSNAMKMNLEILMLDFSMKMTHITNHVSVLKNNVTCDYTFSGRIS